MQCGLNRVPQYLRLALNSQFSCLSLLNARIVDCATTTYSGSISIENLVDFIGASLFSQT